MPSFDLIPATSRLVLIDLQERFVSAIPAIAADQGVGRACRRLAAAAGLLGVSVVATEQVPEKLGPTLAHLTAVLGSAPRPAKSHFSAWHDDACRAALTDGRPADVVVCGVETHVCVLATVADLISAGRRVTVVGDAVDSRDPRQRDIALLAMRDLGALVVPHEAVIFRWQRQAGVGAFKQISALVKD
jgi:nicotinamidase-related amidase